LSIFCNFCPSLLGEVIEENHLSQYIRYSHQVLACHYSTIDKMWTLDITNLVSNETLTVKTSFLFMCGGYYNHETPYIPEWPEMSKYQGLIVHPQKYPTDLDLKDKKVVVIGSGATAATIIPAIAPICASVTMLQRSPTYMSPGLDMNALPTELRRLKIDETWIHEIMRKKIEFERNQFLEMTFNYPDAVKENLLSTVRKFVGDEITEKHFTPSYRPWQQRLALVPDGDLFKTIASGKAQVVTDHIEHFTEKGIKVKSSEEILEADVIISATGFYLTFMGGIPFTIDGKEIKWNETITYRGMMFSNIPNVACIFGYFRSSWTMRVDLISEFICRLLSFMNEKGYKEVIPTLTEEEKKLEVLPWIDESNFNSSYLKRGMENFAKRLNSDHWQHSQSYTKDSEQFPSIEFNNNPVFLFR
jgi:cation diffusion facilitator CzcD-associated flavoprotein CzcO